MPVSGLSEFDIIDRFFGQIGSASENLVLGVGDDCAVWDVPSGALLCVSTDTMVAGRHFPEGCDGYHVASRALGAALSDLAAMGAEPAFFTLSLTLPDVDEKWLTAFAKGLSEYAIDTGVALVGGDTTAGPLTVGIQVQGFVPRDEQLKRSGASPGEVLCVSGTLGDAGGGLNLLKNIQREPHTEPAFLLDRYYHPLPRLALGQALRGFASACIDISDGLLSDAAHLAASSACALKIESELIPISSALRKQFPHQARELAVSAGDDYELLFTMSEKNWCRFRAMYPQYAISHIGRVCEGKGVTLLENGNPVSTEKTGYLHFDSTS